MKIIRYILLVILCAIPFADMAQGMMRSADGNSQTAKREKSKSDDDEDPCVDPDDKRNCWTQDPITGIRYVQIPDTSHLNLANRQTMVGQSLGLVHTGNLMSPHYINNIFDRRDSHDFLFVNAYSLFAYRPEDLVFYDTRIPFTNVSYLTSGSSVESNDRLKINFAGNLNSKLGIGTFLDYVYARGEYISQATKPLKWTSYVYYNDDLYKATLTYNRSKLANQENGGIADSAYVQTPDKNNDKSFIEPRTMPVNLDDTWNDMDSYDIHFNHSYDLGIWRETVNPEDSTDVWDEFTSVASVFHSIDFQSYDHVFRMDENADQTEGQVFYQNHYFDEKVTRDTTGYYEFSTYAGIRLNEGFSRWSQFGLSAFVGYLHQGYMSRAKHNETVEDKQQEVFTQSQHHSNSLFIGGQLSRHQSSFLNFDVTAKLGFTGDKSGEIDISGNLQTNIPAGRNDSITVQASGYLRNQNVSYMMKHFSSNHFEWDNAKFDQEQRLHLEGKLRYSLTGTEARIGIEHISNYHYFSAADGLPYESDNQIEVFSAEFTQRLHWKAIHFDNRLLIQTSTHDSELALPKFVWESDLSLRFVIAKTLTTQMGCTGYYFTKYTAPVYQPATQQFCVQTDHQVGGYPLFNAYVNCNLKRMKFYIMYSGFGSKAFTNNTFLMPLYPLQSSRIEYGVVIDLQN